jgi:eukaryotic-like serine/threonine-protein kinase
VAWDGLHCCQTVGARVVGKKLGHYVITEQIGAGGMGVVYRATDERLFREVAVKVLRAGSVTDEAARQRLRKEGFALSRLNHPNIETVYDFDTEAGVDFLVAELVPGVTLDHKLGGGPLSEKEIVQLGTQLANGLEAAHQAGLLHRDLKPANLRITPDGRLKILDFGLAQEFDPVAGVNATMTQLEYPGISGTLPYLAPEQLRGEPANVRSDIYAAGTVLYEMATGKPLFDAKTGPLLMDSILNRPPALPSTVNRDISPGLETIILKATDKQPEQRYQSAHELRVALEGLTAPSTHAARALPAATKRWIWFTVIAALTLFFLLIGYRLRSAHGGPVAQDRITLAVLPFDILTDQPDIGFLRVGIADAITTKLSSVGQLRLRPTSSVLHYQKSQADARQLGQTLAADYVATGTVQETGERFRVSTQLVRVSDGASTWGEHYDLARADLLSLEDAIAEKVATALKVRISSAERARLYRRYTADATAHERYLQGRAELAQYTRESTLAAVNAFESALHLDSTYALAHAGIAVASGVMRIRFAPEDQVKRWEERARQEAQLALQLDSNLAEAHEALGAVSRLAEFDWERVYIESHRALELNPSLEMPHYYLAAAFYHLGLMEQVEPEVRAALDINPTNRADALRVQGATALFRGHFQEAKRLLADLHRVSAGEVSDWYWALALYYTGEGARAEQVLSALHGSAQAERRAQASLASLLAARHEPQPATRLLSRVTSGTYMDHHVAYSIAVAYAQLGEFAEARRWLAQAAETGFPCYPWFQQDSLLKPLREDPGSLAFFNQMRDNWISAKARYGG